MILFYFKPENADLRNLSFIKNIQCKEIRVGVGRENLWVPEAKRGAL